MHCVFTPGGFLRRFFCAVLYIRHELRLYSKKIQNGSDFSVLCNCKGQHERCLSVFLTFPVNNFVFSVRL